MDEYKTIDCRGKNCPIPLIETRKAILEGKKGYRIKIVGTHENSKKEIPMALESMECRLINIKEQNGEWAIYFEI